MRPPMLSLSARAAPLQQQRQGWRLPAVLCGGVAGTAAQLQQPALWPGWAYGALIALVAVMLGCAAAGQAMRGRQVGCSTLRDLPGLLGWLIGFCVGAALLFGLCGLRATAFMAQALDPALEGRDLRVVAMVGAMPQLRDNAVRMRLEVESAQLEGQPVRLPPLIEVSWYSGAFFLRDGGPEPGAAAIAELQKPPPEVHPGERWELTLRLKAPHGGRNPHGFDYELYLWEQGVQATGYVRASPRDAPPRLLAATWAHPIERARQHVRDAILERLGGRSGAPGDGVTAAADIARQRAAGVVAALVTGDQRAIDRADWDVFRATGVAHLMSISGLHITLFAWLAAHAVGAAWRRSRRLCLALPAPRAALVCGVWLAAGYALFSGWGVPAQRTICMLAVVALLQLSGRRWPWPQVWLLACAAVLLADPWALLQAGFWLSFIAVAVLFASNPIAQGAGGKGAAGRFCSMLREQWVVTLALTPLSLLLFGQVSLVGLLANLVAIPWTTLVVTPLALGGVLWPPLWDAAAWSVQPLSAALQWLAGWPWAQLSLAVAPLWAGIAAVAGGTLLALRLPVPARLLGLPLLLPALWWHPPRPAPGQFELLAADVGQGQAVVVRTARHALLYDAGPRYHQDSDAGDRVLVPLLRATGERLDRVVLSHRDVDHTGGAAAVLAQQPAADVLGSIEPGHPLQQLRPVAPCRAGDGWEWDGVRFSVLHPPPGADLAAGKPNSHSCALRIEATAGTAALLVGDIERAQETALIARGAPLHADLLLVPHHGSRTSSSTAFLEAVAPRTALVQAGYRNRFGHPAPDVARRYLERGIDFVRSDRCGAIGWTSEAPERVRCERAAQRRYWQHAAIAADEVP